MSIPADAPIPAAVADREVPMPHALSRILSEPLLAAESSGASIESTIPAFPSTGTCDEKFWSCPGSAGFKIRGPSYLRDHQKVWARKAPRAGADGCVCAGCQDCMGRSGASHAGWLLTQVCWCGRCKQDTLVW